MSLSGAVMNAWRAPAQCWAASMVMHGARLTFSNWTCRSAMVALHGRRIMFRHRRTSPCLANVCTNRFTFSCNWRRTIFPHSWAFAITRRRRAWARTIICLMHWTCWRISPTHGLATASRPSGRLGSIRRQSICLRRWGITLSYWWHRILFLIVDSSFWLGRGRCVCSGNVTTRVC